MGRYHSKEAQKIARRLNVLMAKAPIGYITNVQELDFVPFLEASRSIVQAKVANSPKMDNVPLVEEYLKKEVEKEGKLIMDYSASEGTGMEYEEGCMDFMILSNNRTKQDSAARKFAKKNGEYGVSFAFYWNKLCFYDILHDPKICVDLRYPLVYIVVDQDLHVRYSTDEESLEHEHAVNSSDTFYAWGKALYQALEEKVRMGTATDREKEIVYACDETYPSYDTKIHKPIMYRALEEAETLNMEVEVVPDYELPLCGIRQDQCDGWSYHPEVL